MICHAVVLIEGDEYLIDGIGRQLRAQGCPAGGGVNRIGIGKCGGPGLAVLIPDFDCNRIGGIIVAA